MTTRQAELLLLLATVAAALGWLLTSFGLQILPPYQFLALRFLIAGTILSFFVHPSLKTLTGQQCWRSFVVGVVLGVTLLFWVMGVAYTRHIGAGAFIASLSVIFVPIIGRLFFAEKVSIYLVLALIPALLGLALLNSIGSPELSQLLFLMCACGLGLHINLLGLYAKNTPLIPLTIIQLITVGLVGLCAAIVVKDWLWPIPWQGWLWILASALIPTTVRHVLQTRAMQQLTANHVSIIFTAEPVWTALLALWLLDEYMSGKQWLGCALIFSALLIYRVVPIVKSLRQTR